MANVSYRLEDLKKAIVGIGYVGENDHMHVLIDCKEVFDEYPDAVPTMAIVPPVGEGYPKAVTKNGDVVEWLVKDSDVTVEGDGEFQLSFTEGEIIRKSVNARFRVKRSISGSGEAPSGIQDWLTDANEKLAEVEQATQDAEAAASHQPYIGIDGYWYTWNGEEFVKNVKAQGDKGDPGDPTQLIDDTDPAADKVFSSSKIDEMNTQLLNHIQGVETEATKIKNATVTMTPSGTPTETDITTQMQYSNGYMNKAGTVDSSASTYRYTQKIPVNEGEKYKVTASYSSYRFVCAFNGDTVLEDKGAANVAEYTVPSGVTHIVITIYADIVTYTSKVVVKVTTDYVYENSANALVTAEETARTNADTQLTAEANAIKGATVVEKTLQKQIDITADQTWHTGEYVNTEGYNGASSSYNRTSKIAVSEGDKFINRGYANWRYVTAYNGDTAVTAKGASAVNQYTVPADVTHLIFTLYSDESMTKKTIIKVDDVHTMENSADIIKPHHVERAARVTFIDDDGYAEFYTYFVPIMQEYGVPMCSAYMGDVCPTFRDPAYMTEEQCRTVEQLGGEIVVHGGTSLTDFATLEEAEANVIASQSALAAHGFKSDVYVYPGGANDVAIREMMARHFKCAFKTAFPQKGDNRVNDKCVPHYFIHRSSVGGYYDDKTATYGNYDTYSLDYFKALVDDAIAKKGWLVFMTHAWMMPIGCSYRLEHDAGNGIPADLNEFALIEDIIEYIQSKKNNGDDIEIVTASEGFEMFKNDVQSGDYLGWWNETYTMQGRYEHTKAGFAVNKLGDIDFADGNRISHS